MTWPGPTRPRAVMPWEATRGSMYHSASGEITRRASSRVLQEAPHLHALSPSARTARYHTL